MKSMGFHMVFKTQSRDRGTSRGKWVKAISNHAKAITIAEIYPIGPIFAQSLSCSGFIDFFEMAHSYRGRKISFATTEASSLFIALLYFSLRCIKTVHLIMYQVELIIQS